MQKEMNMQFLNSMNSSYNREKVFLFEVRQATNCNFLILNEDNSK
jgi:hypothetical protein